MVCQQAKVQRHTRSPLAEFLVPSTRFTHINVDIVGPLPLFQGFRYLLTTIDRYTRWVEAISLTDQTADSVAKALIATWFARFGIPTKITTDQGRQFESELFRSLGRYLGFRSSTTTAYHPQANGLIERQHRTIKAALRCHLLQRPTVWVEALPLVLLGLRSATKEDVGCSSAELLYGEPLRLPGELLANTSRTEQSEFLQRLQQLIRAIIPRQPSRHRKPPTFIPKNLIDCTQVFVRNDPDHSALQPAYVGPYTVKNRSDKYFDLEIKGATKRITIDRLKPAFILNSDPDTSTHTPLRARHSPTTHQLGKTPQLQPPSRPDPAAESDSRPVCCRTLLWTSGLSPNRLTSTKMGLNNYSKV